MSKGEVAMQTIKIMLGIFALLYFDFVATKIIDLLKIIATK